MKNLLVDPINVSCENNQWLRSLTMWYGETLSIRLTLYWYASCRLHSWKKRCGPWPLQVKGSNSWWCKIMTFHMIIAFNVYMALIWVVLNFKQPNAGLFLTFIDFAERTDWQPIYAIYQNKQNKLNMTANMCSFWDDGMSVVSVLIF